LTLYVVGQAFGPCLAAPLSETYGRKGVFLITSPLGILFTLGVGFSKNIASVCILRFFAGVFGSPSLSVGGGIIADILSPVHRSGATSLWTGTALLGTSLGPILCGYAVEHLNWRWTQWIFIFVFLAGWIPSLFTSESYKKILLARKAKKNGMVAPGPKLSPIAKAKFFVTITLLRPFAMLFLEPIVLFLSVYLAVVFSILFSYFDAFPIVFAGVYGFSLGQTGVSFFGLFIGVGAGIGITIWIDRITFVKRVRQQLEKGVTTPVAPEYRLYPAMIGAALISGSMFWFGWTARVDIHWICAEIASFFFGIGVIALSSPSLQYRKLLLSHFMCDQTTNMRFST
jgi:MFS family permease